MAFIGNTPTTQAFTPAVDYFSGNGSTTAFTLSRPVASVAQVQVTIDNVAQNPSSAYTVSSNTITFTSAPLSGTNNIYVYYTSPITQVIAPGQGTVNTTALGNITNIASGNSSLTLQTGSGNTTAVTIDTSQNVGIGTASPATLLHLSSATPPNIRLQSDTTSSAMGIDFYYTSASGSKGGLIANFGAGEVRLSAGASGNTYFQSFYTNASERMRIDSSGNLLVGTTSPGSSGTGQIYVASNVNGWYGASFINNNTTGPYGMLVQMASASGPNYLAIFRYGATNQCLINYNGNIVNTNNSYGAISDVKLKENIVDATPKLADLMQVKVRQYNLKANPTHKQLGVVAQELEQVFPAMVEESKDKDEENNDLGTTTKTVKYSVFVPMLIKAIQELKAINDTQAETINALTARIEALENR